LKLGRREEGTSIERTAPVLALGSFVDREDEGREKETGVLLALKSTLGNFDWVVVGANFEDDIQKDAGGSLSLLIKNGVSR
jgi:hypothetical protein